MLDLNAAREAFSFERLDPEDARTAYPHLWQTAASSLPHLTAADLAVVVSLAADTCPICYAQNSECPCWRAEDNRLLPDARAPQLIGATEVDPGAPFTR